MHVIHEPDKKGLDCNFEQHGIHFPAYNTITIPNFPYFRTDIAPTCDPNIGTHVFSDPKSPMPFVSVSPNPTSGEVDITFSDEGNFNDVLYLKISDASGRLIQKREIETQDRKIGLEIEELPNGVYFFTFHSGMLWYTTRVIKVNE